MIQPSDPDSEIRAAFKRLYGTRPASTMVRSFYDGARFEQVAVGAGWRDLMIIRKTRRGWKPCLRVSFEEIDQLRRERSSVYEAYGDTHESSTDERVS